MSGTWNVTASYDKSSYNQGDVMAIAIVGNYVADVVSQQQAGPYSLELTADDGTKTNISVPAVPVSVTNHISNNVRITAVTPSDGRTWTLAADGKSVSAVA
jgi:hypothetical protein